MTTMKLHNIIKTIGLAACTSLTLASCDVELLPLDTVILENYWTNKDDVESVVNSCYVGLLSGDVVNRMIVWGEVRSDNITEGQQISSAGNDLKYILHGNVLETNSYCSWSSFYTVINRANTVELYAPEVQKKDPNFTESDLRQTMIEVKFLRDLCYFYLIRTFGDVPFTFTASIDDSQTYVIPASKQEDILDTLIMDLESYMKYAPIRYEEENRNSGRVTRNSVYALLADMYLWRASNANVDAPTRNADYLQCVNYCDRIIENKVAEYKEDRYGSLKRQMNKKVYEKYQIPLIEEWNEADASSMDGFKAKAYNLIFGSGHSFESIFELSYSSNEASNGTTNGAVAQMYGSNSNDGKGAYLAANDNMMSLKPATADNYDYDNNNLFTAYDFRGQENFKWVETGSYDIVKYVVSNLSVSCGSRTWNVAQNSARTQNYANWIIYRLTDILLMKAEAEVQIADFIDTYVPEEEEADTTAQDTNATETKTRAAYGNVYTTSADYYQDVFYIVSAIYERACPEATGKKLPAKSSLTSKASYDNLVEAERRRELMFEGKRYYDLLRRARRDGSTSYVSSKLSSKFTENASAMKIKMSMLEFLYMPYSEDELKRNPLLEQNPAFDKEKKNQRNI